MQILEDLENGIVDPTLPRLGEKDVAWDMDMNLLEDLGDSESDSESSSDEDIDPSKAGHGCTLRLPGSLPAGIFRHKSIPGSAGILSHGSPGPTGILPAGHRSTGIKGTCRYSVVKTLRISRYMIANNCFSA